MGLRGPKPRMYAGPLGLARNPYTVDGDTVTLGPQRGYSTTISLCDFTAVSRHHWSALIRNSKTPYVGNNRGLLLHRFIHNTPEGMQTDHEDTNSLNNCRSNLRTATGFQNAPNRGLTARNTSGFKGITWIARRGKWRAQITVTLPRYRTVNLGYFDVSRDAAKAYDEAATQHFGAFARTNASLGLL